jgi:hypothetical protein
MFGRPNYGIDAPAVLRNLVFAGTAAIGLGVALDFAFGGRQPALGITLLNLGLWPGMSWLLSAAVMFWGSKIGKLRECDRLLTQSPGGATSGCSTWDAATG